MTDLDRAVERIMQATNECAVAVDSASTIAEYFDQCKRLRAAIRAELAACMRRSTATSQETGDD